MERPDPRFGKSSIVARMNAGVGIWTRISAAWERFENSILGDLVGVVCLFGIAWAGLVIAGVLQ